MPLHNLQRALSPDALEHELAPIRDVLSLKESEESWDKIAKGIQMLTALVRRGSADLPQEVAQSLRSLAPSINAALLSERSRLSAVVVDLLSTAAEELGRTFDVILPVFFPPLLSSCTRTNKVFLSRARACIITIVQSTQSTGILTYLSRSAKDKSVSLRLTTAEAALTCLNSFNPPDLQREARSQEVELLIKCAATDANPDIRKVGRKLYDAYKILLPSRVDSFTAPLTPTIKKYLNIAGQQSHLSQSNPSSRPPSRPTSSLSTRSGLNSSSSSAPASIPADSCQVRNSKAELERSIQSSKSTGAVFSHNGRTQFAPGTSHPLTTLVPPSRPRQVAGPSSGRGSQPKRHLPLNTQMLPPDFIPSREQRIRLPQSTVVRSHTSHTSETPANVPLQRTKTGPLRPTQSQVANHVSLSNATDTGEAPTLKRPGGARRVPLPEIPSGELNHRAIKGIPRPESRCEPPAPSTHEMNTDKETRPLPKRIDSRKAKTGSSTRPKEVLPSQMKTMQGAANKSTGKQAKDSGKVRRGVETGHLDRPTEAQTARLRANATTSEEHVRKTTNISRTVAQTVTTRRTVSKKAQSPSPSRRGGEVEVVESRPEGNALPSTESTIATLVPVPPAENEHMPHNTEVARVNAPERGTEEQDCSEVASLSSPTHVIDVATPKTSSQDHFSHVQQTPISALVNSIQQGFLFTPRPGDNTFDEDDEEADNERTFTAADADADYLAALPLSWGPLSLKKSCEVRNSQIKHCS